MSESPDFVRYGPGRGGKCKYLYAARIFAAFDDAEHARAYALVCLAEAHRRRECRVAVGDQVHAVARGTDAEIWKYILDQRAA